MMKASEQSEKRGSRIKELLYEFYAQILMQNNFSFPVWFICYVISYAQMLDFLFHPFFDSMTSESFISSIILNVFEYTSLRTLISNQTLGMVFLIAASVVIIYQVAAYVYFFVSVSLVYSSTRKIAKMGGLSLFFVIFNIYSLTLFYPTTLSYFMFVAPTGERGVGHPDKIDGTYMTYGSAGHIVVSVVVIFLWSVALIVQAATALLTTELSSQRLVSWSSVEPYTRLAIMIIKIYQSVMLCFFNAPPTAEIAVVTIMAACLAIVRLNASVSTVRKVHFIESFGDMFYTCMGLYVLTTQIWKAVGCEFILACVVSACIAGLYLLWLRHRLYVLLILPYIMHIKRPVDAYNYICGVEVLLESRDDQSRGLLAGIALNHNRICDNVTCWCQDVKNAMSSKGKDPGHRGELRDNPPLNVETEKAVDYQNRSKIGRWLLSLQTDIMMSQNNALMNILVSYIYYFYIGNAYQSLNYLDIAETFKPSFLESFAIYIHRRRIESAVLQMHDANLFEGAMPIDIVNTLEFSATYNDFLEIVQTCADTYHEFWKELMKDLPDCKILSDCGRQISEKWQNIQKLFNKLLILMPKNMNYLYLFGLFIKYITNDSEEAKKIHQKLVYIRNSKSHLKGPEYEKYQDEGKAMMFLVSGSRDSIGRIKEVNIETEKILGYARKDLRGNKVNKLMCSVLAETHDGFITRFYETLISNKVNHSFFQYFKESSAFYIPVQMLVRVVPNLSDGLEFCCLCYRNESNPYVASKINKTRNRVGTIICDESFKVLGITRSCARTLKLPPNIAQKGFPDNFVLSIFPMLRDENARNKLFENRGRVINYNLDRLQELDIDDEDAKTPGGEPTKYVKKDDLLIWVRLVKQDFNDSKAVLILIVLDQVPNIDAANYIAYDDGGCQFFMNPSEGAGPRLTAILPQIFRMNSEFDKRVQRGNQNPFDYAESVFAESMLESLPSTASQSSSSIGTISKDLTAFKERIAESEDPTSVKRLRIILIIFVVFIVGVVIAELVISLIITSQLSVQFDFVGYLSKRMGTLFLATNRIRMFASMLDTSPVKPTFSQYDLNESKTYLQEYADIIVASHQQIVQVEEDLNLDDGATPVSLVYKNKYMENEVTIINYSFAIIEFVVKMLQIIGYDSPAIDPISANFSSDTQALYNRTRDFLIYNGNVSLRLESEQIMDKYLGILKDKADSGKLVYLEYEVTLNSVSLGVIIILFALVIPIVIKVVGEKSLVMKGFAYVTKKEIVDIMNWASAFNVRSSAKSLKLLAETRKDKVYAIMQMQNEKEHSKEEKTQPSGEMERARKLRTLIRNLFKFEEEGTPEHKKEDDLLGFENSLPEGNRSSVDDLVDTPAHLEDASPCSPSRMDRASQPKLLEDDDDQTHSKSPLEPTPKADESASPLDPNAPGSDGTKKFDEEKIIHKRKKDSLSKIDTSLRRRALMKVSCIFVLFIIYAVLNIVYIVMFHSYAVKASNQYNDIQMRRPLMSEIVLMCRQAFFENDTHYLTTQTGSGIEYLPEYRNRLLTIEESLLDFEKSGPHFIFPGYIDKLSRYNSDQFCAELKPHITTSVNCSAYDSGFFKNGLRSTQFRYITFWQSLAQQFLKDSALSNAIELGTYQYNSDINRTINGTLLFTDKATQDLIDTFDDERVQFLNVVNGISWGKAMAMIFILLLVFVVVFISFLRQLKEEISLTKAMMKMIPVDLLQANTKLLHKVLRGSA